MHPGLHGYAERSSTYALAMCINNLNIAVLTEWLVMLSIGFYFLSRKLDASLF